MSQNSFFSTPIAFEPIFKEKIWGGRSLETSLAKEIPSGSLIGESWEISGYGPDLSVAVTGEYKQLTIQQILEKNPKGFLGDSAGYDSFPLLCKFIDANDKLSVQVHPDNEQVTENNWGLSGKTECWYIADAQPGAQIIVGFKSGVTLEDVRTGIQNNSLGELLNQIPVIKGDMLFIPSRTVHAILDGTLLYEVQQTSDITFRLYDWGRVDKNGTPRQLHIAESLKTVDTTFHEQHKIPPVLVSSLNDVERFFRVACRYFAVEEYVFQRDSSLQLPKKRSFSVITVLDGAVSLYTGEKTKTAVLKGQTILLPADCYRKAVVAEGETDCRFLVSSVPDLKKEIIAPLQYKGILNKEIALLGGNSDTNDLLPLLSG